MKKPTVPATLTRPIPRNIQTRAKRLKFRDAFFRSLGSVRQLLEIIDNLPGVRYFVKDAKSRMIAVSRRRVQYLGLKSEIDIIGLTDLDYLPSDQVGKFLADDQRVIRTGRPLRNRVEMGMDENGFQDWTITDKYPLTNARGKVIGLIGTVQFFDARLKMLEYRGPVGKAVDFIREHLGDQLKLPEIARHANLSERQLQRLFRKTFGMTIHLFILRSRIQRAIYELTHTRRTIGEIALMFGFCDQSAFTHHFRALAGMPPRVYRDRYVTKLNPPSGPDE